MDPDDRCVYEVSVEGSLGPVLRGTFQDMALTTTPACSVVVIHESHGPRPDELLGRLEAHGIKLLEMRCRISAARLPDAEARRGSSAEDDAVEEAGS